MVNAVGLDRHDVLCIYCVKYIIVRFPHRSTAKQGNVSGIDLAT